MPTLPLPKPAPAPGTSTGSAFGFRLASLQRKIASGIAYLVGFLGVVFFLGANSVMQEIAGALLAILATLLWIAALLADAVSTRH